MDTIDCAYCTDTACGLDDDNEPTCGADACAPIAHPLPTVIEVSGDDDGDDQ